MQSFQGIKENDHGTFNQHIGDGTEKVDSDIITCETNPENDQSTFQIASTIYPVKSRQNVYYLIIQRILIKFSKIIIKYSKSIYRNPKFLIQRI